MLKVENTILIVIDVQEKMLPVIWEKDKITRNIQKLVQGAQVLEIPILVTEQYPQGLGATVPEIIDLMPDIEPLSKVCFSCYGDENFKRILGASRRRQVLICGVEAHVCVYQTALELKDAGYEVQVAADAVSSRTAENREIGLNLMKQKGILITGTETALFELLKTAETGKFKTISKIVK